ncbi:hypothetical protein Tco_1148828 [Tanacetum coccineum]
MNLNSNDEYEYVFEDDDKTDLWFMMKAVEMHEMMKQEEVSKGKGLLGPIGENGGKFERGLGGNVGSCGGNGGRGRSIAERGGGSLAKRLMKSKRECLDGWVGANGGEVKGGGVDFGVSRTLLGEIPGEIIKENGGEVFGVDGGAV